MQKQVIIHLNTTNGSSFRSPPPPFYQNPLKSFNHENGSKITNFEHYYHFKPPKKYVKKQKRGIKVKGQVNVKQLKNHRGKGKFKWDHSIFQGHHSAKLLWNLKKGKNSLFHPLAFHSLTTPMILASGLPVISVDLVPSTQMTSPVFSVVMSPHRHCVYTT